MTFQNCFSFERFKEMTFEEFCRLFATFDFSLKADLKKLKNPSKSFELDELNIPNLRKKKIFEERLKLLDFLAIGENLKFNLDMTKDKLFNFSKDNLGDLFKKLKEAIIGLLDIIEKSLSFCKGYKENVNFDKILVTALSPKFK